ncbi:hypothetical protein CL616_04675 [archaeon]|nr:hypothetical protein [archaeon]
MKDRQVGYLVIAFCIALLLIIISYDMTLAQIVNTTCSHGPECPMYANLKMQRIISLTLLGVLVLVGLYFIFSRKIKQIIQEKKTHINLTNEEKEIISLLKENDNSLYQSNLIKQTEKSKVQITRILDKLEAKKIIDRKRRGMTNIIILR